MTATSTKIVPTPFQYEPMILSSGKYVDDDLKRYTCDEFKDIGVKCPCSNSTRIHRNKYTFKYSHCNSIKHTQFIEKLNNDSLHDNGTNTGNLKIEEYEKIIKSMKIQVGKEHQNYLIEKQRNETLKSQLKDIITENEELSKEKCQRNKFICLVINENKVKAGQLKQYEDVTKMMMRIEGYEVSEDD
jgi:hypothetical protein